ncbi:MAG TPA: cyclodeaminase/cyclohydrolase family protein [Candidatus Brocadiia bacterium]|nr:cyclodeaminase/cyclohydrolase family protein [Planctomycetota bacterium]MDO8094161.1 cyclodeaminase/cyclohydrolase family protein [Candidatus Brocadiales bacterium]
MPLYRKEPLEKYLADAATGNPTPGGGSVSALVGALGTTMAEMSANFTIGREKFKGVEPQAKQILGVCTKGREDLVTLMQKDTEAYSGVLKAYGMPKSTPEEKAARTQAIQRALTYAMEIPLLTVRCSLKMLEAVQELVNIANPNLIGDVGAAAIFTEAALRGARINVEANLTGLKDESLVSNIRKEIALAGEKATTILQEITQKVTLTINK